MKKHKIINIIIAAAILFVGILPLALFWNNIKVTVFSIPAICLFSFHLLYGLAAYVFRHKGNYLRFSPIFIRFFVFKFIEPNEDYTYTKKYKMQFYRMLALYFSTIPMYIPCILLTSSAFFMPFPLIVFLLPQIVFILFELRNFSNDIIDAKKNKQQREQELKEQKRREEMGRWK